MKHFLVGGILLAGLLAGATGGALAQAPPRLAGRWQAQQISLLARRAVPHEVQEQMNDSAMALTNAELRHGTLRQVIEIQSGGTYRYEQTRTGQPPRTEVGTYAVRQNVIEGHSPGTAGGSSFARWRIARLGRRQLVLEQPIWADSLRISQQIEFRRLPPGP